MREPSACRTADNEIHLRSPQAERAGTVPNRSRQRRGHIALPRDLVGYIGLGPVTGLAAAAVMASTTLIASPLLAGLSFFLLGVGPILWVISTTTLRQSVTPPRLLGRVSAINIMSYGARPVGSAFGAIVGGFYGAEACLYLAVAIFGAQALVILMSPAVALARQPEMVGDGTQAVRAC